MELKITIRNQVDFSIFLEEYLREKVEKLERFNNQDVFKVEAIISEDRFEKVCELLTRVKGKDLIARAQAPDFPVAIDQVVQRLKIQLEKYFGKKIDHKRRSKE
ncbi:MAG TPA: ribosome-associated translation inhibitor RaiA [bacterium]|uniref:Ribosome hibernation promoting factor HPF n=1 Tax=candidate division TA06 bacterium ADurb.Bin417 TaxID=1852828 RepID=A0A1V5MBY1_UNCT6|nr:MAG: ribosome hibernation promoting factor HPF [candidate division TA06 bacterium ADurb.Bin417]HNQ35899.1 ribosome-associated translation inhibitor RaiA [bacterium]HNS49073.1 ribosome-associated translation inhibitor RaiA [bacterium]